MAKDKKKSNIHITFDEGGEVLNPSFPGPTSKLASNVSNGIKIMKDSKIQTSSIDRSLKEHKPSNRVKEMENDDEFSYSYSLDVRPEFEELIIKRLKKALDRTTEEVAAVYRNTETAVSEDYGIHLLSTSLDRISEKDLKQQSGIGKRQKKPQLRKKRHVDGSESEDEDLKLREVAVSADWVLNKNSF